MRELPNGLKIQDAKVGDGPQAKKGMKVSMRYIGKLEDGKVFDSNTKGKPVRRPALTLLAKDSCVRLSFTVHIQAGGW
jgi:FKBP-type peptidyl-prolyl cis-trans isomerase